MSEQAEPLIASDCNRPVGWPFATRVGFRFVFIYWATYCLQAHLADPVLWMIPWGARGLAWLTHPLHLVVLWVGVHLFHLNGAALSERPTASSDRAIQYVLCLCLVVFALAGAAIWTIISELRAKRIEYRTLYAWLRLGLRFTLGMILLQYGFLKVFGIQFIPPPLVYLTETYGDSSPMRLMWAFMGASVPYTIFGGLAEIVPAVLLLFWRTSTLGALISSGVLLNVVLLNFCYDVPVKLFSTHLLLASLFLLLPDAAALWRIFFAGGSAALTGLYLPPWERRPLRWASRILQVLIIGSIFYQSAVVSYREKQEMPVGHAPLSLYGVWAIDKADGLPPQETWTKVIMDDPDGMYLVRSDGKRDWYFVNFDRTNTRIEFLRTAKPTTLQWTNGTNRTLVLSGSWLGNPVTMSLHRLTPDIFPLQARGFHWVQEYPYNR
jgi:hypothetical protein